MKKIMLLLVVALGAISSIEAQDIKFESEEINYGSIDKGADGLRIFKFKNVGTAPLVIENAVGSCGCTVPTFPREPIMPGAVGEIRVKYDTQRVGAFTKYVTVTTNAKSNTTSRLKIYGDIKPEAQMSPPKEKSLMNN